MVVYDHLLRFGSLSPELRIGVSRKYQLSLTGNLVSQRGHLTVAECH